MKKLVILLCLAASTYRAQVPVMTTINGASVVCASPSTPSTFSTSASNSPTSYSWSVVPSASVVITNASASVTPISFPYLSSNYTLYCTATNSVGTSAASSSFVVTVNETPIAVISGSNTFCQGISTTLIASASVISPTPSVTYSWIPSTGLNTTSNASVVANPSVITIYTVTTTKGSCMNNVAFTVTPLSAPVISISPAGSIYTCPNNSITLTATGANTYTWTGGVTNGVPFVPSSNYTVFGTASNGCIGYNVAYIFTPPIAALFAYSTSTLLCFGNTATLQASSQSGPSSITINGVHTTSLVISPTVTTNYSISCGGYMTNNGSSCGNSIIFTQSVSSCDGINEVTNNLNNINIYPNPANNVLTVDYAALASEGVNVNLKLEIINNLGQVIQTNNLVNQTIEIAIKDLPSGVYQLKLSEGTKQKSLKFIKN